MLAEVCVQDPKFEEHEQARMAVQYVDRRSTVDSQKLLMLKIT